MTSHFSHAHAVMSTAAAAAPPKQTEDIKRKQRHLLENLGVTSTNRNRMRMDGNSGTVPRHQYLHGHHLEQSQRDGWERDLQEMVLAQEMPLVSAWRDIGATSYDAVAAHVHAAHQHHQQQQQQQSMLEQYQRQHRHQKLIAESEVEVEAEVDLNQSKVITNTNTDTNTNTNTDMECAASVETCSSSTRSTIRSDIKMLTSLIASDLLMQSVRINLPWTLAKRRLLRKRRQARPPPSDQKHSPPRLSHTRRSRSRSGLRSGRGQFHGKTLLLPGDPSDITKSCLTGRLRGLPNHGQTCFLNCVLQALASLTPFLAYLERILRLQEEMDYAFFLKENAHKADEAEDGLLMEELSVVVRSDDDTHQGAEEDWDLDEHIESDSYRHVDTHSQIHTHDLGISITPDQEKRLRHMQDTRVTPLLLLALRHANANANDDATPSSTTTTTSASAYPVDTRKILNRVAQKHTQFQTRRGRGGNLPPSATCEQQDAQELLQALMSVVISESHLDRCDVDGARGDTDTPQNDEEEGDVMDRIGEEPGTPQQHSLGGVVVASGLHTSSLSGPSSLFSPEEFMMLDQHHRHQHQHEHTLDPPPSSPSLLSSSAYSTPTSSSSTEVPTNTHTDPHSVTLAGNHTITVSTADKQKQTVTTDLSHSITLSDGFCNTDEWTNGASATNGDDGSDGSFTSAPPTTHAQDHHVRPHDEGGRVDNDTETHGRVETDAEYAFEDDRDDDDDDDDTTDPNEEIVTLSSMLTKVGRVQTRFKEEEDYHRSGSCKLGGASRSSCSSFSSAGKINDRERYQNTQTQHSRQYCNGNGLAAYDHGDTKASGLDVGQNALHRDDQPSQEEGILILDGATIAPQDAATATTTSTTTSSGSLVPIEAFAPTPTPTPTQTTGPDPTIPLAKTTTSQLSTSMQMMIKTLSSITPSPLNGWFGSTLQCCSCKHTSPIQNAPFLEIPVVPTSLSHFQKSPMRRMSSSFSSPSPLSPLPACTLDECLSDFTAVEKVHEVDCRACAIEAELTNLKEEGSMLRGAIRNIASRRKVTHNRKGVQLGRNGRGDIYRKKDTTNAHANDNNTDGNEATKDEEPAQALSRDLQRIENRIKFLQGLDPDDGDILVERDGGWYFPNHLDDDLLLRYCSPRDPEADEEKKCDGTSGVARTGRGTTTSSSVPKAHRGDANKRLLLTRLPPILCLHAKRLFYDPNTDRMAKAMQHITFQEYLDLSAHCAYSGCSSGVTGAVGAGDPFAKASPAGVGPDAGCAANNTTATADQKPIIYRLMSVIEHRGNAYAGHYLTYRRIVECSNGNNVKQMAQNDRCGESSSSVNEWAMASDEKVSHVSWREVSQCQAYMLFYEAI